MAKFSSPVKMWANAILTVEVNSQITMSSLLPLHGELIGWSHEQVKASSRCEIQTHRGLTARSQCELIWWGHYEVDEWLQNELAVSFHVSSQCVSCELKFFTGMSISHTKPQCIHHHIIEATLYVKVIHTINFNETFQWNILLTKNMYQ